MGLLNNNRRTDGYCGLIWSQHVLTTRIVTANHKKTKGTS
jgi:hypothetical protein